MAISFFLLIVTFTIGCLYQLSQWKTLHLSRRRLKGKNNCLPPRKLPQKGPILGTDIVLENLSAAKKYKFLALLQGRHERNGMTFTTDTYLRTTIITCDPNVIKSVLSLQFEDFGMGPLRRKSASPLLGKGVFTTDNELWSHQRALIRPSFIRAQVADFTIFESHVDQLIQLIKQENCTVDLQQLFFRMVLDSNSDYLFGESVGLLSSNGSDSAQTFHNALDYAQQGTILRLRLENLMWAHRDTKFRDSCSVVHEYADKFVARALEHRKAAQMSHSIAIEKEPKDTNKDEYTRAKYVFLDELAKDTDEPIVLRDQIVNMLLAARDTTAGLLSFAFYMLTRKPDVFRKMRAEVLEHWCEPLSYDAVMQMTYLRFVLQETLRLFPPIATNSRMANKDTVIPVGGGPDGKSPLFVTKNNVVTYSTFVMYRRQEHFGPDAHAFRPERWETARPGWEYLLFNGGPRICPGQKFALTESSYTIARLLQAFSGIENIDSED